jgi:hypothetical protein
MPTKTNAKKTAQKSTATKPRPVLVTTEHRGVFFGYAVRTDGPTIKLKSARLCLYWEQAIKGFMGLASNGPSAKCRIGPAADIELRAITAVAEVTPTAALKWESAPWAS